MTYTAQPTRCKTEPYMFLHFGSPAVIGYPQLEERDVFGLKVGDKVIQVGRENENGKITSACRVDRFPYAFEYCGVFEWENEELLALKCPDAEWNSWCDSITDLFYKPPIGDFFLLYIIDEQFNKLYRQLPEKQSILVYDAIFVTV